VSWAVTAAVLSACGGSRHAARAAAPPPAKDAPPPSAASPVAAPPPVAPPAPVVNLPPPRNDEAAPLDPEIKDVPNARAVWFADPEYGNVYVVLAGPERAAAPPLVMVHGLGTNGVRDWYSVLPPLAAQRRVVLFDLPGFGRSGRENLKYAPSRYAAVMSRVIDAYGPGPVDVMGHSMGGAITLYHASAYPDQLRRLVVVDAAGILHRDAWFGHHLRRVTDPASIVLPKVADMLGEAAELLSDTSHIFEPAPDIVLEFAPLRKRLLGGKPERIAALGLILQDYGPVISSIRAPTLVVWGADDMVTPLRTGLLLADRLPDARLVVLPGIGHQVMAQAPSLLVPEVERHLAATGRASRAASATAPSQGKGVCNGQADLHLSGVYDSIVVEDCMRITLDQVRATSLVIRRSTGSIVRSTFSAGITAEASTLIITGGAIGGDVALDARESKIDLAGVSIAAGREPFRADPLSRVLLSVCPVRSTDGVVRYRHGFVKPNVPAQGPRPSKK
jgi:pimeloyl-ACP methyl ester carboxylesterase